MRRLFHFCLVALAFQATLGADEVRRFPDTFEFGTATAAYQVEGGWNEDGRTECIWDYLTHTNPDAVEDRSNGDIAADSYHKYLRDVEMMQELNLDFYRFSISWNRVLPNGFANEINQPGIDYYNNLINELISKNIEPMVTMYHWDIPQKLQDLGGFTNPLFVDWFVDYARVLYQNFGDRIKTWITFNEPQQICYEGYGTTLKAPLLNMTGIAEYLCARHLLLAHAKTYELYNKEFRDNQQGITGITIAMPWFEPLDPESPDDVQATKDYIEFEWGQFSDPIFSKDGDFPSEMKRRIKENSLAEGFPRSRLPEFSQEEIELIKGSSDFLGINVYTTNLVYRNASVAGRHPVPSLLNDVYAVTVKDPEWPKSVAYWLQEVPWGFYRLLKYLRDTYDNPTIYVTENGWTNTGGLNDDDRVRYFNNYLNAMLDAIEEGVNVQKYAAWSLMDNFEWLFGYVHRFGLYEVDFEDPERTRTARKSAYFYGNVAKTKSLDPNFELPNLEE